MILYGVVETGLGDFGKWISVLQAQYERKTGMHLYPGTLNVRLPNESRLPEDCCRLEAAEYGGTVSVNIVPCTIFGRHAVILRTDRNNTGEGTHPRNIVEIASDIRLRDRYNLKDGDPVSIEIEDKC